MPLSSFFSALRFPLFVASHTYLLWREFYSRLEMRKVASLGTKHATLVHHAWASKHMER